MSDFDPRGWQVLLHVDSWPFGSAHSMNVQDIIGSLIAVACSLQPLSLRVWLSSAQTDRQYRWSSQLTKTENITISWWVRQGPAPCTSRTCPAIVIINISRPVIIQNARSASLVWQTPDLSSATLWPSQACDSSLFS